MLTVKDVHTYCKLSKNHFSRIFKQGFGMRPVKYIKSERIQRAQL